MPQKQGIGRSASISKGHALLPRYHTQAPALPPLPPYPPSWRGMQDFSWIRISSLAPLNWQLCTAPILKASTSNKSRVMSRVCHKAKYTAISGKSTRTSYPFCTMGSAKNKKITKTALKGFSKRPPALWRNIYCAQYNGCLIKWFRCSLPTNLKSWVPFLNPRQWRDWMEMFAAY